ncbi:MAG TPA: type VI secretion system baseplate subunit TssE [Nitrospiria bacterium]|nr:type VI secretion system baseplate subunit TssE [Nitrospiria bacterium]
MGREKTLLERLADPEGNRNLTVSENTEQLADSILRHLRKMLNTRQGHALIQPEYGMPDVTEFRENLPEMVEIVQQGIRNSVEKFEPRLRNVTVSFVPSQDDWTNLRFEITGELVTEREEASVWFETSVSPEGHIEVKG